MKKKVKNLLINLSLLIITLILLFIFTEISLRMFYPQRLSHVRISEDLIYENIPGRETNYFRTEFFQKIRYNKHGMRDYEYNVSKKPGSYRIVFVGDSFVEALQVGINETMENLLENMLGNYYGKKIESINLGVSGYQTAQELISLKKKGMRFNPDLVLLGFFVGNDFINNLATPLITEDENGNLKIQKVKFGFFNKLIKTCSTSLHLCALIKNNFFNTIGKKNTLLRRIFYNTGLIVTPPPPLPTKNYKIVPDYDIYLKESIYPEQFDRTKKLLKLFDKFVKENNLDWVLVIIPTKEQVDKNKLKKLVKEQNLNNELDVEKAQKFLKQFAEENNISYIDLLPEFKKRNVNNTFYFEIDGHWNKKGNKLAAEIIFKKLVEFGLIK